MKKAKSSSKAAAKATEQAAAKARREELVVFAFRLTIEERDAIHAATGAGKASQFARTLLVAAARKDNEAVKAIVEGVDIAR